MPHRKTLQDPPDHLLLKAMRISVQYIKARLDPPFTNRAQRFNEGKSLAKDIDLPEKDCRCVAKLFFLINLAAFTNSNRLADCLPAKNLIHMSCNQILLFSCHALI